MRQKTVDPAKNKLAAGDDRIITGYAATWDVDIVGDVIQKGAFAKTLNERRPNPGRKSGIKVLRQHNPTLICGSLLDAQEDDYGLMTQVKLYPSPVCDAAYADLKAGELDTMSIGFDAVKWEYDSDRQLRVLTELRLWEVSYVAWPANPNAVVTDIKSIVENFEHLIIELKEGRMLSAANRRLVEDAVDSMGGASKALQALLAAAEAGKSTSPPQKPPTPSSDPGDQSRTQAAELLLKECSDMRTRLAAL